MDHALAPAALRKVPPELGGSVSMRAAWTYCALEQSCFGPIHLDGPAAPFHHLGVVLSREAARVGMQVEGRREQGMFGRGALCVIAAGDAGAAWWDRPVETACFYFTGQAMDAALGRDIADHDHDIRTAALESSPIVVSLLHAMHADALAGQPHGYLRGDVLFAALAAQLVAPRIRAHEPLVATIADRRVRHALAYIHAHLAETLSVEAIAFAAATSPFHLARCFRSAVGCTIWQYVLRERARHAASLMRNHNLDLALVASRAGFDTYASFVTSVRRVFGTTPAHLRSELAGRRRASV